jgi:multiple sugar transport system substrate-binding protein
VRRARLGIGAIVLAALIAVVVSGCGGGGSSGTGKIELSFWDGQTQKAHQVVEELVGEFNKTHPRIHVSTNSGGVTADTMLPKVTAGLQAGSYPDIAYIFGSDLANLAKSEKLLDLDEATKDGELEWSKFDRAARETATVEGKVRAVPSLVEDLAVVYNKKLFEEAGIPFPKAGWNWEEFREDAIKLTNSSTGVVGTAWPATGDEDTTWRIWPMVWQLGGEVVAPEGEKVGYEGEPGLKSLTLIDELAEAHAIYLDTSAGSERINQVFNAGKLGMAMAGNWSLPEFIEGGVEYGVAEMPSFSGEPITIAGPDVWAIFDHGDEERSKAAIEFISWFTAPQQNLRWDEASGSLPTRTDVAKLPGYAAYVKSLPHLEAFIENLKNARVRPTITQYPEISKAMGKAVGEMLYARSSPEAALNGAVEGGNAALSSTGIP